MKKDRRKILLGSLALVTTSLSSCDGGTPANPSKSSAISKNIIKWKMATAFPKNFPGSDLNAQKVKNNIEIASEGRLVIEHFGAGELVPAFEVFDAVRNGTIDCGISNCSLQTGFFSTSNFHVFSGIPPRDFSFKDFVGEFCQLGTRFFFSPCLKGLLIKWYLWICHPMICKLKNR